MYSIDNIHMYVYVYSYHFVLLKSICKTPVRRDEIVSLAYECDEMCTWGTILDVHMFADDSFTWFVT